MIESKSISLPNRYTLHCRDQKGDQVLLYYSPYESYLVNEQGIPLFSDQQEIEFETAVKVSPDFPAVKSRSPKTLKIQLGLGCNYSCSYCNQAAEIESATVSSTSDVDIFLQNLEQWLQEEPERIEFWGGEPFLYFAKLRRLVPALKKKFPKANFTIVTNGSLLGEEIRLFICAYDIYIAISHDGPGQHLRGPDPFEDVKKAADIRELWKLRWPNDRISFNVVLSPASPNLNKTRQWLAEKVGDSQLRLSTEGPATIYDKNYGSSEGQWTEAHYKELKESLIQAFVDGSIFNYLNLKSKSKDFLGSLRDKRPATALGQKCGMDKPDQIAVDLQGNVMTCQNTGAQGKHRIGHVSKFDEIKLNTAWHWSHRESCNYCPVLQLCKGSCMYLEGDLFALSCENEYHYNTAILAGILKRLTGLTLESISGDIRRPSLPKKIFAIRTI
ncbi:MAG: SPASM domain-containing protein [Burkholderiales bacterium]|nr:SPASM domain-containing protein [Burkholderiales bacterium]